MSIDINHVIKLANIKMTEDEVILLAKQLENIVNWLDVIAKVDTTGIEPMHNKLQDLNVVNIQNKDSIDVVGAEKILANAPEVFENFFVVPKIIDN